jgi:hypothetical protein
LCLHSYWLSAVVGSKSNDRVKPFCVVKFPSKAIDYLSDDFCSNQQRGFTGKPYLKLQWFRSLCLSEIWAEYSHRMMAFATLADVWSATPKTQHSTHT